MPGPCWALAGAGRTLELEGEGQLVAGEAGGRPGATPLSLGIRASREQSHEDGLGWGCQKLAKFTVGLPQPGQPLREACLS